MSALAQSELRELLGRIVDKLVHEYQPEKIILFGSYAYGNPTEDSDIDLFIIKDTDKDRVERFVEVKRLIWERRRYISISPLVYTPDEVRHRLNLGDDFVEEVVTRGEVLYGR